ncbi:MAG: alpha-ketoacid dehydrogenase subunit beta, partial [Chlamydiia bacterium]|nr:alpha-ketoacid dehydrogenase subunit beta [Chlamydiia bacterium]
MAQDERVFLIGEDVGVYGGAFGVSAGLRDEFGGERVIDTPISENAFAGLGIGAAMAGLRPIVEFMSFNFSFVGCDQIISNAAKMYYMSGGRFSVPIVFRGPNGAAAQVSSQHSHCVEAFYGNLPGLKIVAPSTPYDAKGLLKSAIRDNNPVLFLECELDYGIKQEIPTEEYLVPLGQAIVRLEGADITFVSHSRMVRLCLEAAKELAKRGVKAEVVDLRTIRPMDLPTVFHSVRKTHHCVLVEEGHQFAGIAAELAYQIQHHCMDDLDAPVARVCQRDTPMPYSVPLEKQTLPTVPRIVAAAEQTLSL